MDLISELLRFMENDKLISVEVAYAAPKRQLIIPLEVKEGCNMLEAVILSGIIDKFPEIEPGSMTLGIFSKVEKSRKVSFCQRGIE